MIYANTSCVSTWSLSRLQLEYIKGVNRLIYSSSVTLLDGACRFLVCFVYFFYVFIFSSVKVFCCAFFVFSFFRP